MDAESFKRSIAPHLKAAGFLKSGATWRRQQDESVAVLNVQKSAWGGGVYYINAGTYFRKLGSEERPAVCRCHVSTRLDVSDPDVVARSALEWFKRWECFENARALTASGVDKGRAVKALRLSGMG